MQSSSRWMDRAGQWFLRSGIQEPCGGVARYYRSDLGANARISTEITGYAASALLYLHSATGQETCLEAARRAGRFLSQRAFDAAAATVPFEYACDGDQPEPLAFFFDLGIIVRGLLALARATGEEEFLRTAEGCAASMITDFAGAEEFHPVVALPSKQPVARQPRWSRQPGCYQLKAALAWFELFHHTGRPQYRSRYEQLLDYALRTHTQFLPGETQPGRVMDRLHAYCYFLEGLLPSAAHPECSRALAEGIRRATLLCDHIAPVFERSDAVAQLLRLRLLAANLDLLPLDRNRAALEAAAIERYQLAAGDPRLCGGFCFGREGSRFLPYLNPASTAFAVQALRMWRQFEAGALDPAWQALI